MHRNQHRESNKMKKQRNILQTKEQDKTSEKTLMRKEETCAWGHSYLLSKSKQILIPNFILFLLFLILFFVTHNMMNLIGNVPKKIRRRRFYESQEWSKDSLCKWWFWASMGYLLVLKMCSQEQQHWYFLGTGWE